MAASDSAFPVARWNIRSSHAVPAWDSSTQRAEEVSDDELMMRAREGCSAAFSTLVERHQQRIFGIAYRYLGDAGLAQDVTQNTFVALHGNLAGYDGRGRLSAFIRVITINQCRMITRTRWHKSSVAEGTREPSVQLQLDWSHDLQKALSLLSEKLRVVIILHDFDGMTCNEVAEVLGIPVGTVKRRRFDALAKLRAWLEGEA